MTNKTKTKYTIIILSLFLVFFLAGAVTVVAARAMLREKGIVEPSTEPVPSPSPSPETVSVQAPAPSAAVLPEVTEELPAEAQSPTPLYATIWPVDELEVYSDVSCENALGTVQPCSMYCVLEENAEKHLFKIRYNSSEQGYIDSNYCLINLPDYLGDLCAYCISNSFDAEYTIHEYFIPNVTGMKIPGYERVKLADGTYLVPLLYPTAQKLIPAAEAALSMGYRIKLYDAYRPREATDYIYYTTQAILNQPLPGSTWTGRRVSLPEQIPEAKEGEEQRDYFIYLDLIELWNWDLSAFLAPGASRHNMGVAVDMTLENIESGEEITAQTRIHDLSAYSTIYSNNDLANTMYQLMEKHDMHNIVSEWWHFQDNASMNELAPPYCSGGVSAEGWIADAGGEKYRAADGTIYKNCILATEDGDKSFDANGYLIS